jgi:hypothetical protein
MGAATGVLDNMQETHPEWAHWGSFCFAVSLANAEWLVCYELSKLDLSGTRHICANMMSMLPGQLCRVPDKLSFLTI